MRCLKAKIKISAYLDGELNVTEKQELLLQLNKCGGCRKELEELSLIIKKLELSSSHQTIEPSPYFYLKIKQKIAAQEERKIPLFRLFPKFKPVFVGFNLIIIFFISGMAGNYLVKKTESVKQQKEHSIYQGFETALNLDVFNDIPSESFSGIYNNLFTGEK